MEWSQVELPREEILGKIVMANNKSEETHIRLGLAEKLTCEIADGLTMICNLLAKSVSVPK